MDNSIFSLFTTKDWPFLASFNPSNSSSSLSDLHLSSLSCPSHSFSLRSRVQMVDHLLFFDRLMLLANIKNHSALFPPPHPSRLRQLLDSIDASPFDLLKKNCMVYYLLKEYHDGRETQFAINRLIPAHFTRGIDGLWALDHSQWQLAIRSFAHPSVTPDFLPEIIRTLASQPPTRLRADLLLCFDQLAQPILDLPSLELLMRAKCSRGHLRSAWALQRSFARPDRDGLVEAIFESCFGLNDAQLPQADSLAILAGFPFDELEHSLLAHFAVRAPTLLPDTHARVVVHFYLNKLIAEARYIEAIRFERELAETAKMVSDPDIDRLIRGIVDILPEVQRNMLELEFDHQAPSIAEPVSKSAFGLPATNGLGSSYDLSTLAWDPPASPPPLPAPSSLAEARDQQLQRAQPQPGHAQSALPLSASPILRRTMPRTSLERQHEPQKALLKALAHHAHPSVSSNPASLTHKVPMSDPTNVASQTPRFTHFVGPSRLPASSPKPPGPGTGTLNFSTSMAASGSPFHRLSLPTPEKVSPARSAEERWPTRIVFTPHQPSQKKRDGRGQQVGKGSGSGRKDVEKAGSNGENQASRTMTPVLVVKKQFEGVVVPREPRLKSPPKKMARLEPKASEGERERELPGGFVLDEEMADATEGGSQEEVEAEAERSGWSENRRARTTRRKAAKGTLTPAAAAAAPMTPRRSRRLHSTTPAKMGRGILEEGDLDEEDDFEDGDREKEKEVVIGVGRKTGGKRGVKRRAGGAGVR